MSRQLHLVALITMPAIGLVLATGQASGQSRGGFSGGIGGGGFGGSGISGGGGFSGGFRPNPSSTGLSRPSRGGGYDPFAATRGNPQSMGQFGGNQFGMGNMGGNQFGSNFGNRSNMGMGQFGGMGNVNRGSKVSVYSFRVTATIPPATVEIQPRLEEILQSNSAAKGNRDIRLETDGSTLVMRGTVNSEREKQLADAMVRLEPGVYDVRNELEVAKPELAPPPRKVNPKPPAKP